MMYTYPYDTKYNPSMPVVELGIRRSVDEQHREIVLTALIDSGADATILPFRYLKALKARYARSALMSGVTEGQLFVDTYQVTLRIGMLIIPSVYVVADKRNRESIVGRDVLNQLMVTLNGLASMTEITG